MLVSCSRREAFRPRALSRALRELIGRSAIILSNGNAKAGWTEFSREVLCMVTVAETAKRRALVGTVELTIIGRRGPQENVREELDEWKLVGTTKNGMPRVRHPVESLP
jgi:hypothetical protein